MRLPLIVALVMLSACQLGAPEKSAEVPAANPITAGQISVTPLDGPPPEKTSVPDDIGTDAGADVAPVADATVTPPVPPPKSAAQAACEKGKGTWVIAGKTGTMSCQRALRDSGKQCRRDRDCEGQCLARSRTCAPFTPLFGCNEVLQDNGQRVTICID